MSWGRRGVEVEKVVTVTVDVLVGRSRTRHLTPLHRQIKDR